MNYTEQALTIIRNRPRISKANERNETNEVSRGHDAADLLGYLRQRDVRVVVKGDCLHLDAPAGVLTRAVRESLAHHRPALLVLAAEAA